MNIELHAICDSKGRPLDLFVTAGQVSDYIGARALLKGLPQVDRQPIDLTLEKLTSSIMPRGWLDQRRRFKYSTP